MLEVCFNDSVKGALACAQHCEDSTIGETVGFTTDKKGLSAFLDREKVLTKSEIAALANRWQLLKAENMPLRVVENGIVVSADESYYDHLIRNEFPQDTCKVAHIIGSALGRQKILTGDVFIAKRVQAFISSGELSIVKSAADGFYGAVVSRAKLD